MAVYVPQAALIRDRKQRQDLIIAQLAERQKLQAEIKAVRDQQAGLLRDLRKDSQNYRAKLPEKEKTEKAAQPKPSFEQAAQRPSPHNLPTFIETFGQRAAARQNIPTPQERLKLLHEKQSTGGNVAEQRRERDREP